MKRAFVVLALVVSLAASGVGLADELSSEKLISKSWDLYRQTKQEKESVKMVISYSDGRREEKKLIRWTRFDPANEDCITIKFLEPPLDRGLGLLTLRHGRGGGNDEQYLKLPSLKKVRKIAAGEQAKYFAGTDLTNEDVRQLIGERFQNFTYTLAQKEGTTSMIAASPRDGVETGYGRRLLWVDDRFVITKVEYFDKKGELIKVQTNSSITLSENGLWRANHVEMDNLLLKRKTQIDVEEREIDKELSSGIFSKDFLESERTW
jgi:hypothetical protein